MTDYFEWVKFNDGYQELHTPFGRYSILPNREKTEWYLRFENAEKGYFDTLEAAKRDVVRELESIREQISDYLLEMRSPQRGGIPIAYSVEVPCKDCRGAGKVLQHGVGSEYEQYECEVCSGGGYTLEERYDYD